MPDIAAIIDKYLGKPYKPGGRGPDAYDCWGLVMAVSRELGRELPDIGVDGEDAEAAAAFSRTELAQDCWQQIQRQGLQDGPGAIVAMGLYTPGAVTHTGITLGNGRFIHCIQKKNVCVEPLERYQRLIEGYYEYHG